MKSGFSAVFSILVLINKTVSAQSPQEDSAFYQEAISNTLSIYNERLDYQSPIYNGSRYLRPAGNFKAGSPYFPTDSFTNNSWVVYDDIRFDGLNLLYEDLKQHLVSKSIKYQLQLVNQRVNSFSISGHRFIRLVSDSSNPGIKETGFYEELYQGRSVVLKWTTKVIVEEPSISEGVVRHIDANYDYFIKKGNRYYQIKSKRELAEVFQDRQKEMERFIKKSHLKFRRDPDNTLIQSVRYYDLIRY
jgi:hypothetical protein